jgi:hypothetical protein
VLLSRCSRAIDERVLRSQSTPSSHLCLAPPGTRLFLHFAQRTPVATTLCSCMIARRVCRPETRQKKPTPSRVFES